MIDLELPDLASLTSALAGHDREAALALLVAAHPRNLDACTRLLDWSLRCPLHLAKLVGGEREGPVTSESFGLWRRLVEAESVSDEQTSAGRLLLQVLLPRDESITFPGIAFQRDLERAVARMNDVPDRDFVATRSALEAARFADARDSYARYLRHVHSRHRFLSQYVWVYRSVVSRVFDRSTAATVMDVSRP